MFTIKDINEKKVQTSITLDYENIIWLKDLKKNEAIKSISKGINLCIEIAKRYLEKTISENNINDLSSVLSTIKLPPINKKEIGILGNPFWEDQLINGKWERVPKSTQIISELQTGED